VLKLEIDASRRAHLDSGVNVGNADLPGQHTRRVVSHCRRLNAEVDGVCAERNEIRVLRTLVDHRDPEPLVERALGGQVTYIQHRCQPGVHAGPVTVHVAPDLSWCRPARRLTG
jgi:hypothetical protein